MFETRDQINPTEPNGTRPEVPQAVTNGRVCLSSPSWRFPRGRRLINDLVFVLVGYLVHFFPSYQ